MKCMGICYYGINSLKFNGIYVKNMKLQLFHILNRYMSDIFMFCIFINGKFNINASSNIFNKRKILHFSYSICQTSFVCK